MGIIARTLTKGFRTSFFRNQPVHQFYGHLQAVLREIAPDGELDNLFARPEYAAEGQALPSEIEWSTPLDGDKVMFKDLSPDNQQAVADQIARSFERIRKYSEDKQSRTGKEKDYAEYLRSVAVSPDLNQIFMVKKQPVLVHWGFVCEDGSHPGKGIYAGWDDFITQIQRQAGKKNDDSPQRIVLPPEPPPEVAESARVIEEEQPKKAAVASVTSTSVAAAATTKNKPTEPPGEKQKKPEKQGVAAEEVKPKPVLACGLGEYRWVKWLAIILAIIILLLLLLRFIPSPQAGFPGFPSGIAGGLGGAGGAGGSDLDGLLDKLGGGGKGGQAPAPGSNCPTCGHKVPESKPQGSQPQDQVQPRAEPVHGHNQSSQGSQGSQNNQNNQNNPGAQGAQGKQGNAEPAPTTAPVPVSTPAPAGQPAAEAVKPGDNQ